VKYELRPAVAADLEALFAVHVAALREAVEATWGWDDDVQRRIFTERFDAAASRVIVVEDEVAGHLVVEPHEDEVFLARVALLPAWQGHGIGSRVVADVVRRARGAGLPTRLHVLRANGRARALYERLGFREYGGDEHRHYMRIE
jgi:ribosomal protein S18 acetylase RimI-like enzyme